MPATTQGREHALEMLRQRREANRDRKPFDNSSLHAGSPMYFNCIGCNDLISAPEGYLSRPSLCVECQALKELGWLE